MYLALSAIHLPQKEAHNQCMLKDEPLLAFEKPSPYAFEVPVLKVFDGDGFLSRIPKGVITDKLTDHEEIEVGIRFGFIDAPELDQPGGLEAKEFLTSLIGGRTVWISVLTKHSSGSSIDRFNRLIAVPYLGQKYPASMFAKQLSLPQRLQFWNRHVYLTRNIELEMVLNGWAWVLEHYSPDDHYLEAQEDARSSRRGIWESDVNVPPWEHKQRKGSKRKKKPQPKRRTTVLEAPKRDRKSKILDPNRRTDVE
jgi:endonuclease YncB( thermonuclease family)